MLVSTYLGIGDDAFLGVWQQALEQPALPKRMGKKSRQPPVVSTEDSREESRPSRLLRLGRSCNQGVQMYSGRMPDASARISQLNLAQFACFVSLPCHSVPVAVGMVSSC